ncbi:hypothetical protein CY34DRAFT_616313 [Suillus luteus UH-Slu-Lm8-n1]|uniref:Uncharacterized protein n=1 Tax=Suillus luteus UH-Slu-Lm8-n1 TaxID=930992 RepID=A0A0D0BEM6_9AGAM|nr:hypothetical protein CY34DRAFT_616313 [Suillus luteus UH-Slu-Lm8-n1]
MWLSHKCDRRSHWMSRQLVSCICSSKVRGAPCIIVRVSILFGSFQVSIASSSILILGSPNHLFHGDDSKSVLSTWSAHTHSTVCIYSYWCTKPKTFEGLKTLKTLLPPPTRFTDTACVKSTIRSA